MPGKYLQQTPQAGSTDTVPAMLTPGEFVIRKDAADEIGRDKLHAMNNIDRLSGMAAITNYKPAQFQEGGGVGDFDKYGMNLRYDQRNADKILKSLGLTQSTKGRKGYKYPEWSLKEDSRLSQLSTSPEKMKTLQELIRIENYHLQEEPERQRITDYLTKGGFSKKDIIGAFGPDQRLMGRPLTDKELVGTLLTEVGPDPIYGFHGEEYESPLKMRDLPDMEPEMIPRMQEGGEVTKLDRYNKKVRSIRPIARKNPDGSESTVLMESVEVDGRHYAIPTLYPKSSKRVTSDPKDWKELSGMKAFKEASKRDELFEFSTADSAAAFAEGSWKFQEGGEVHKRFTDTRHWPKEKKKLFGPYEAERIIGVPAEQVGGEGGHRYYLSSPQQSKDESTAERSALMDVLTTMAVSPQDSIPGSALNQYYDYSQRLSEDLGDDFWVRGSTLYPEEGKKLKELGETAWKKARKARKGFQEGGEVIDLLKETMAKYGKPVDESLYTPEGGRSMLGFAEKYGLTPETVGVDTLYYRDPGDYMFGITGETPEGERRKGTTRYSGASPLKQDVDDVIDEYFKGDPDLFAGFEAKQELTRTLHNLMKPKEEKEPTEKDILKEAMFRDNPEMTEEKYQTFLEWKKKHKYQEGGEVMNYYGGGMVRDARARYQEGGVVEALEAFGEKSKSADDLSMMARLQLIKKAQLPAAPRVGPKNPRYPSDSHDIREMFKEIMREREPEREYQGPPIPEWLLPQPPTELEMRPPSEMGPEMIPDVSENVAWEERPTTGLQQGGPVPPMPQRGMMPPPMPQRGLPPAGFMQEGGEVEQPMPVGEAAGMQEMPVPEGERAYPQEPPDQLELEEHEYAAYVDHGPDVYKYLAPKYKQQTQWTPYDAMVDAGIINPYEKDKDDFVIMAREQANALRAA